MPVKPVTDAASLAALHTQGFDAPWPLSDFKAHIENPLDDILGITQDGQLAGFILIRTVGDQSEILTITVQPEARQTGIASALLTAAETAIAARGADIMFLDVAEDNPAAIALYRKHGYAQHGRRPAYYKREANGRSGRVAALLFQKRLRLDPRADIA